jgi:hypothetical protein
MDPQTQERANLNPMSIAVLVIALAGCATPAGSGGTSSSQEPIADPKAHILRVAIDDKGQASDDPIKVKEKVEIVVWIGPENSRLDIRFPADPKEDPFPQPVICAGGRFCASLLPPPPGKQREKLYKYGVTLTTNAGTITVDPGLKVVP